MEEVLLEALATLLLGAAWFGGGVVIERLFTKKEAEEEPVTHDDLEQLKAATVEAFGVYDKKIKRLQKRVRELEGRQQ